MKRRITVICSKCGKEITPDKEGSNENWALVTNKPSKCCNAKIKFDLKEE